MTKIAPIRSHTIFWSRCGLREWWVHIMETLSKAGRCSYKPFHQETKLMNWLSFCQKGGVFGFDWRTHPQKASELRLKSLHSFTRDLSIKMFSKSKTSDLPWATIVLQLHWWFCREFITLIFFIIVTGEANFYRSDHPLNKNTYNILIASCSS